jgi:hypothetical protein
LLLLPKAILAGLPFLPYGTRVLALLLWAQAQAEVKAEAMARGGDVQVIGLSRNLSLVHLRFSFATVPSRLNTGCCLPQFK